MFLNENLSYFKAESYECDDGDGEDEDQAQKHYTLHDLTNKNVSSAVFEYQIERECRRMFNNNVTFQGTKKRAACDFMEKVDKERRNTIYEHKCSTKVCEDRGCLYVTTFDGIWKIREEQLHIKYHSYWK